MRFILMMAASLSLLAAVQVHVAVADDADGDTTAVAQCEGLPPSVTIPVMTGSDTTRICRDMMRVLEGVRRKDITKFEKAVYVMQHNGYAKDGVLIAQQLVEIILLRVSTTNRIAGMTRSISLLKRGTVSRAQLAPLK
jgi:hypothetical protein